MCALQLTIPVQINALPVLVVVCPATARLVPHFGKVGASPGMCSALDSAHVCIHKLFVDISSWLLARQCISPLWALENISIAVIYIY